MKQKNVCVSLYLPEWLYCRLCHEAMDACCPVSHFIRVILLMRAFSSDETA